VIVVSDTTAITSLLKIGRVALLRELFGEVLIPNSVCEEQNKDFAEGAPGFAGCDEKAGGAAGGGAGVYCGRQEIIG
jgi:hypothetical protein